MTKPFEHVLGLIPKGVMAGLFWYMGTDALLNSGVTAKMLYLVRDPRAISPSDPLNHVRKSRIILFTLIQLIGFGATFAITQTIAAIGFPVVIILMVPVRFFIVPHLGFSKEELEILDGPVASPFVSTCSLLVWVVKLTHRPWSPWASRAKPWLHSRGAWYLQLHSCTMCISVRRNDNAK